MKILTIFFQCALFVSWINGIYMQTGRKHESNNLILQIARYKRNQFTLNILFTCICICTIFTFKIFADTQV